MFCRIPLTQVQTFLRHRYDEIKQGTKKAKKYYKKEQCAQLQTYAAKKLDRMLDETLSKSPDQSKKRGSDGVDAGSESDRPRKKQVATVSDANPQLQN